MYIGVSLVDNKKIQALNKKYLKRDYPTDVLSFNYIEAFDEEGNSVKVKKGSGDKKDYLGDVVVSTEKAREQAEKYGNTYEEEISELVAHGVLHLLGVHHDGDR